MGYRLLRWFWLLVSHLPLGAMYALSSCAFYPLYYLRLYRRGLVRRNLAGSFPEMSPRELRRIERRFYRYFIDTVFETCKMATISPRAMDRRMRFTNIEEIASVLAGGRSVSLWLGHYGNWEWVSSLALHLDPGVVAGQIYRRLSNRAADRLLLSNRERLGAVCIEMRETARRINALAAGGRRSIIGFIADQAPRRRNIDHWVPFLRRRLPVSTTVAKLTLRYGFEPWYLDVRRVRRGYWEARFVRLAAEEPGEAALTAAYYRLLERTIRRRPEFYLWTHNRFRHAKIEDE